MCRELKWEQDRLDDLEYEYELKKENLYFMYQDILYEFNLAYNYYKKTLKKLLYKEYNCYIDYKLLYILNLPSDIQDKICYFIYQNCKEKIFGKIKKI